MEKIWDLLLSDSWKDYRQIRAMREGEQLMKSLREENERRTFNKRKRKVNRKQLQYKKIMKLGYVTNVMENLF